MESVNLPLANESLRVVVREGSAVGAARRAAARLASKLGLDPTSQGKLALVVTEAGTNLVRHAGEGELLLRPLRRSGAVGVELLALDKGPGMGNLAQCLTDGYSTSDSSGTGLGGIQRMSNVFDLYSQPQRGSALVSEVWSSGDGDVSNRPLWAGAVCVELEGEDVCGDGFAVIAEAERAVILIVDGLGHGQGAADASLAAIQAFQAQAAQPPRAIVERMDGALRSTRGAALAVVELSWGVRQLRFAGVGNCAGTVFGGDQPQSLASYNGIVGGKLPRLREFTYPWPEDGLLVLHTDGMNTRWSLDPYPGLSRRHPSLIAGVLYRDFSRQRDDVTVLAVRPGGAYVPSL